MTKMLEAALWYHKKGFNVIPAKRNKHPYIAWKDFQKVRASEGQLRQWWKKWPKANVGIITGIKSNLTVLDADTEKAYQALQEFIPDSLLIPTVKTPKGWHLYFQHVPEIGNGVKVLDDCDIRSEGGYVVAPPSANGRGNPYAWVEGLHINDIIPPVIPDFLKDILLQYKDQNTSNKIDSNSSSIARARVSFYNSKNDSNIEQHRCNNRNIFTEGRRDNDLFRLANCLIRGGMPKEEAYIYLKYIAKTCSPPFSEKDAAIKVESALRRQLDREKVTTAKIRDFVGATFGNFNCNNLYQSVTIATSEGKAKARAILSRMVANGEIERVGQNDGWYRRVMDDTPKIDILNVETKYLELRFPLDLQEYYRPMQKNIVVIAGTQDVGKTAFMLNVAKLNMNRGFDIRYCTSEMGGMELRSRLELFEPDIPINDWVNVDFREVATNFQDSILPDGLTIIDYLEISDSFYQIGQFLTNIYNKLNKGIAVVALQKDFKSELGRGGTFSLEKPRLYVSLTANPPEGNIAKIVKCKNWARPGVNPNNLECVFKVIEGAKIRQMISWSLPNKMLENV